MMHIILSLTKREVTPIASVGVNEGHSILVEVFLLGECTAKSHVI